MSPRDPKSSQTEQDGLPKVGDDRLVELGDALRQEYADIQNEPVPETLQKMIEALKEAEKRFRSDD
nr:NepR family anti-sigma factor [Hyphomonas sp. Mor2]